MKALDWTVWRAEFFFLLLYIRLSMSQRLNLPSSWVVFFSQSHLLRS